MSAKKPSSSAASEPRGRGPGRRFVKGQSGNPGGRKPGLGNVREMARTYTLQAITTLAMIMRDNDEQSASRVRAAEALLDRGWGKATQPISGEDGNPIEMRNARELSDAELLAILNGIKVTR